MGISNNASFGVPNTASYGQTFTADSSLGSQIDSFTFLLRHHDGGTDRTPFAACLAAWDGGKITGPLLYESEVRYLPADPNAASYTEFSFNTRGVELVHVSSTSSS